MMAKRQKLKEEGKQIETPFRSSKGFKLAKAGAEEKKV